MLLKGKNILLGVTGGIAAYKSCELLRALIKQGATVNVAMSENAKKFITPLTCQTLSGNPVLNSTFDTEQNAEIKHISLPDEADSFVIAPATANIIGKLANGIADDFISTMALAYTKSIILSPAMNIHMYENKIVQYNLNKLKKFGFTVIEPAIGYLACGYEGRGRLPEIELITDLVINSIIEKDLQGISVVITAGPTREHIDPVRYISNPSTGKMGYSIAKLLAFRGATVNLVSGPSNMPAAYNVNITNVTSAEEMNREVEKLIPKADLFIGTAAVADYRPVKYSNKKIKKESNGKKLNIDTVKNPDIISNVSKIAPNVKIMGFAAETNDLINNAKEKLSRKKLDLIFANDLTKNGSGFGTDTNSGILIKKNGEKIKFDIQSKEELANKLIDEIKKLFY